MQWMKRVFWGVTLAMGLATGGVAADATPDPTAEAVARQQIEYLRREYGRATDLIGTNVEANIEAGRAIYHRVFTPDVAIAASAGPDQVFRVQGADNWVDVVAGALEVFDATQHLIGTQLVTIEQLPDAEGKGGSATMTSYLQAWHSDPDRVLDIFIGTYHDKVRYTPGVGWQIYDTYLEKVSGEVTTKGE